MSRAAAIVLIFLSACDVFRGATARPRTTLSEREFVEVYVALSRARTPDEKTQVLKQHGTSAKELETFVQAYANNLTALSEVFDSVVARQGLQTDVPEVPR